MTKLFLYGFIIPFKMFAVNLKKENVFAKTKTLVIGIAKKIQCKTEDQCYKSYYNKFDFNW